jgi:hypothetical protein
MISLFKALLPAIALTWVMSIIMGSNGSKGGFLYIHLARTPSYYPWGIDSLSFYWSWPLFFASTILGFFIFKMLE